MRCSAAALTVTLLVTTVAARLESVTFLTHLKKRFLEDLGMERFPDMKMVNTSRGHFQRMSKKYWRRVTHSERELITFHHTGCSNDTLLFNPVVDTDDTVEWARLRFPNSSTIAIPLSLLGTRTHDLTLSCSQCCGATLQLRTTSTLKGRKKRSTQCDHKNCCRRSLTVNFKEIGWDWIVQPPEFEAFFCKGRCAGNGREQFASTHALVQSMLNAKRGVGRLPCCAPRKLKPLDLLHYNDKTPPELVVTRQKGMIVKQCACT